MSKFGWSLPPGVSHRDIDEAAGAEGPCAVCCRPVDDCKCPECPRCGEQGNERCYRDTKVDSRGHGMRLNREQVAGRTTARVAVLRQRLLDEEQALSYIVGGGEFDDSLASHPDPWN